MPAGKRYPPRMSGGNSHLVAEALERICQTGQIVFVEEIYLEHSALLAGLRADLDFLPRKSVRASSTSS